jgi:hypothetical protein
MPIVLKSGSLNLLEPSGPVKACNGIDLPLPLYVNVPLLNGCYTPTYHAVMHYRVMIGIDACKKLYNALLDGK